jgi:hypothetical protein
LITGREDYPADLRSTAGTAKTRASGQVSVAARSSRERVADLDTVILPASVEVLGMQDLAT